MVAMFFAGSRFNKDFLHGGPHRHYLDKVTQELAMVTMFCF